MKKINFNARSIVIALAIGSQTCTFLSAVLAQEAVDHATVTSELAAARSAQQSGGDADLEAAREKLLAAEAALLGELSKGSEPAKTGSPEVAQHAVATAKSVAPQAVETWNEEKPVPAKVLPQEVYTEKAQNIGPSSALGMDSQLSVKEATRERVSETEALGTETKADEKALPVAVVREANHSEALAQATKAQELARTNNGLQNQLKQAKARAADLARENSSIRDRLMIAETEVERLAGIMRSQNANTLARYGTKMPAKKVVDSSAESVSQNSTAQSAAQVSKPARVAEDTLVATVVADKANLRTGPGKDNSPFMNVPKGTRLVVETRNGDWYRVITPSGTRAWVASEVLAFGDTPSSSPTRTVRIKGYDSSIEDEAFSLIRGVGSHN